MTKYDYILAMLGQRKVQYNGNVYEIIATTYKGVIMQSTIDDTHVSITYRELRLNAEVFQDV